MSLRREITRAIGDARDRAIASGALSIPEGAQLPPIGLERPANPDHGDWATNAAMQLAPIVRAAPLAIAGAIHDHFGPSPAIASVEAAAPGFLNIRLAPSWVAAQVGTILDAGAGYGHASAHETRRINVEFVSANPTGPLTVGNARGAFVGDVLSRVLEAAGHDVTREYYFNDFNEQIRNLGATLLAVRRDEPIPPDGYHGDYVADLVDHVPDELWVAVESPDADGAEMLGRWASERVRQGIESSLARLGVRFDVWTSEGAIHDAGWVERGIEQLRKAGHMYEADGALWFRSSEFGDDKDRVVIRSNGRPTYFAADIGYVAEKFSRGFDELIYVWGADHHGTVARNRAAAIALGFDADAVRWPLIAWVRFVRDGVEIPMSKRSGEFITLDELLDEVGADGARWYFSSRAYTTGIDFDLELAKRQSNENPVYYAQYAHARASSILRHASEEGVTPDASRTGELLVHPSELALVRHLLDYPDALALAAERRETHEIPRYVYELASAFSQFYRDCKVLGDEPALSSARLALVDATRSVLANALDLLGISAPTSM